MSFGGTHPVGLTSRGTTHDVSCVTLWYLMGMEQEFLIWIRNPQYPYYNSIRCVSQLVLTSTDFPTIHPISPPNCLLLLAFLFFLLNHECFVLSSILRRHWWGACRLPCPTMHFATWRLDWFHLKGGERWCYNKAVVHAGGGKWQWHHR